MTKTSDYVLLVDGDAAVRGLLASYLENAGYQALHAGDGLHAIRILRDKRPKVIVSGLGMPHMSGIEFIGVVRQRFPTLPVIAFFGSMPDEFPAGTEPDRLFEKRGDHLPELMKAINELARRTPDGSRVPQAISVPVRTVADSGGDFSFSCPDCLRAFMARVAPKAERIATTAACTHCGGHVPFLHETAANA